MRTTKVNSEAIIVYTLHQRYNKLSIALFADDTSILQTNRKNDTGIQRDVNELINWYTQTNSLSVRINGKLFGSGKPEEIQMMNNTIPYKMSCKFLGINIDSSLRFSHHIDYL